MAANLRRALSGREAEGGLIGLKRPGVYTGPGWLAWEEAVLENYRMPMKLPEASEFLAKERRARRREDRERGSSAEEEPSAEVLSRRELSASRAAHSISGSWNPAILVCLAGARPE